MKKWFKGLLSLVLALALVFGLMPSSTFAAPGDTGTGGREGEDNSGGQYYVEWLPYIEGEELLGLQMHLIRLKDGGEFLGPQCRYINGEGRRVIQSEYASYVPMTPTYGATLDQWLTKAEEMGYNGNERREQLTFDVDNDNGCYAKWTVDVEDGYAGEYAIFIRLYKRPQGTWGYFCDTNGDGGHTEGDVTELGITPGEARTLPEGTWKLYVEKRGDWEKWADYESRNDIGSSNWSGQYSTDGGASWATSFCKGREYAFKTKNCKSC